MTGDPPALSRFELAAIEPLSGARWFLTAAPARRATAQDRLPPRPSLRSGFPTGRLLPHQSFRETVIASS
jgi:hypothetical protein